MSLEASRQDERQLASLARELRAIAAFGLNFADNTFDEDRYRAVLAVAARLQAMLEDTTAADLLQEYEESAFALSAMPSAEAVVMREDKILLVHRRDDGLWALPGGITDPGETLAGSVLRELKEETGIDGRVRRLLGIFDSRLWQSEKRVHFYHALFQCDSEEYGLRPSAEVASAAYFGPEELPPLSNGHHLRVPFVFKQLRGEAPIPYFDR